MKARLTLFCCLLLTVLLGAFLRFYNLNWDEGYFFHPDERNIALAVSRIRFFSQLNPRFFAYGSFPIYLYRALGEILALFTKNQAWVYQWNNINLVGRGFSAFFSTISILLVFFLVKEIWDERKALLSAFFVAFTPSLIQTAHFAVTESMLVFWLLLLTLLSLKIIKRPSINNYLKIGLVLGLALATKVSSLSFLIIPLAAHFLARLKPLKHHLKILLSLLSIFLIFSLFSPYAYKDHQKFLESMNYESGVVSGRLKVVYVLQFEKTIPYLFQIKNLFWQMGPAAFLGILGLVSVLILSSKSKDKKALVLLSFPIAYFLYVGSWHTKFIRYMVPLLPFLAIFTAWSLSMIHKNWRTTGKILTALTCLVTLLWSLSFFSVYLRESTRISASKWVYQNIPQGTKILQEHWDDGLPISVNGHHSSEYETEQLTIYDPDSEMKARYYAEKLAEADYLIINSRRLYGTLRHLPEKYPITSRYYDLLFSEKLGYTQIAQFTSYPSLFGFEINDDKSEETFQVYDHPKVIVFKNTGQFNQEILARKLIE